jgi:acetoin utilization protein AcuB
MARKRRSGGTEKGSGPGGPRVSDILLRDFVSADAETSLADVVQIMNSARIRHLVLVAGGQLQGVLSYRDVQDYALLRSPRAPGLDALRDARARDLMRRDPIIAGPEMKLRDAARRMLAHRVGCLPVVDGAPPAARLVGLLTESSLLRAAFELGG